MRPDPRTEAEVREVLARIIDTAERRDVDGAMAMFADDADVFLYGTGVDEARKGPAEVREQIERDLSQSDAWSWTLGPQNVSSAGAVAWTAGDLVIRVVMGDRTVDIPHRLTLVLERRRQVVGPADASVGPQWSASDRPVVPDESRSGH